MRYSLDLILPHDFSLSLAEYKIRKMMIPHFDRKCDWYKITNQNEYSKKIGFPIEMIPVYDAHAIASSYYYSTGNQLSYAVLTPYGEWFEQESFTDSSGRREVNQYSHHDILGQYFGHILVTIKCHT